MAHCKNVEGGPGDDERHPPHLIEWEKRKGPKKTTTKKKCKRGDIETERAVVVAVVVERAERGDRGSGICIDDQLSPAQRTIVEQLEASLGSPPGTILLGGQRVALEDAPEGTQVEEVEPLEVIKQQVKEAE